MLHKSVSCPSVIMIKLFAHLAFQLHDGGVVFAIVLSFQGPSLLNDLPDLDLQTFVGLL